MLPPEVSSAQIYAGPGSGSLMAAASAWNGVAAEMNSAALGLDQMITQLAGEEWLGRNRSSKRRLWERLNPRSRRQIRLIAEALALQQTHAQLPDSVRGRLSAAMDEVERLAGRLRALLAEVARRTPPRV